MKISAILQDWFENNSRDLPWRRTTDPYKIWLSEIILQQTRVAQGLEYYNRFISDYPTISDLANASEDDILKHWQGLGYYSRARNLHKAAKRVIGELDGVFPTKYAQLIKLPGIGPYTASAIASFSCGEPVATVDGNVYRVLSRLFDIETPIDSTAGQKLFAALAQQELDEKNAGAHNQAMMEFGALHCTPTSPNCADCPLTDHCLSFERHTQSIRPVKEGKVKIRERYIHYYIYKYGDKIWAHQRGEGDIWQGLWEFSNTPTATTPILEFSMKHQLTHQTLYCTFSLILLDVPLKGNEGNNVALNWEDWQKKAVPKPIFEANRKISAYFQ